MEPISLMLGLGMQIVGTGISMYGSSQKNEAQNAAIKTQYDIEGKHQEAMELDAKRKDMEILRMQQRARAMALSNATNQGSAKGSGLQGGYGQISGQSGVNLLGVNQNLEIGRDIFGLNTQLSQEKIDMASAQQTMEMGAGLMSLGGSVTSASKGLSNLFSGPSNSTPIPNYGNVGGSSSWWNSPTTFFKTGG